MTAAVHAHFHAAKTLHLQDVVLKNVMKYFENTENNLLQFVALSNC